jgi:hypothetical protein
MFYRTIIYFVSKVMYSHYRRADNSRSVSFTVRAWEWVYATNLPLLQRQTSKRQVGEAHSKITTAILLPQHLSCYGGKIVSLRMHTNFRLGVFRLTTAQQRTTGQNQLSDLYLPCLNAYILLCKQCQHILISNNLTTDFSIIHSSCSGNLKFLSHVYSNNVMTRVSETTHNWHTILVLYMTFFLSRHENKIIEKTDTNWQYQNPRKTFIYLQ